MDKSRKRLYQLAKSESLWERRISIIATFHFIKGLQMADTLKIARLLLADKEDLIHKAVGWMLREVGKRDLRSEEEFLNEHCRRMPRTMCRRHSTAPRRRGRRQSLFIFTTLCTEGG